MSLLRARCPRCHALTAVAIDEGYECHSCGASFAAGLVRVPRAWGDGGEPMVEAAALPLDYPEVAVVEEDSLVAQTLAVASDLPVRPLVLGGCCCSHIGAVEALSARHERLGVRLQRVRIVPDARGRDELLLGRVEIPSAPEDDVGRVDRAPVEQHPERHPPLVARR